MWFLTILFCTLVFSCFFVSTAEQLVFSTGTLVFKSSLLAKDVKDLKVPRSVPCLEIVATLRTPCERPGSGDSWVRSFVFIYVFFTFSVSPISVDLIDSEWDSNVIPCMPPVPTITPVDLPTDDYSSKPLGVAGSNPTVFLGLSI